MDVEDLDSMAMVGYILPDFNDRDIYIPADTDYYCKLCIEGKATENLKLEIYSPYELSDGEISEAKEDVVSRFGAQALAYDVVERRGYLPVIGDLVSAAISGGLAATSGALSGWFFGLYAGMSLTNAYKHYKNLREAREKKKFAEDVALHLDAYQGHDPELEEKIRILHKTFDETHGSEEYIYRTMAEEADELGLPEIASYYRSKLDPPQINIGNNDGGWGRKIMRGIRKILGSDDDEPVIRDDFRYKSVINQDTQTVEMRLKTPVDKIEGTGQFNPVRHIPVYVLPVKDGYEFYLQEKMDMFYLMSSRDDARVEIDLITPEGFGARDFDTVKERIVNHMYDTIYSVNKLNLLTRELLKELVDSDYNPVRDKLLENSYVSTD